MDRANLTPEEARAALPPDLPDDLDPEPLEAPDDASLLADIDALFEDGKTYVEAEIAYQKSRAGFTANRLKWALIYGAAAFGLIHLALIGLTVGAVIALAPLVGPWIATGVVVMLLLVAAMFFVLRLRARLAEVRSAFDHGEP